MQATTTLCCPRSPLYFGTNFVRPGNNVIIQSVVDATSLRAEQGTDPSQIVMSHFLQGCTTPKNSEYNYAVM